MIRALILGLMTLTAVSAWAAEKPLYERLGGKPALKTLIQDSIEKLSKDDRLMSDPKLKHLSQTIDHREMTTALTRKICQLSGGPCKKEVLRIHHAPEEMTLQPMEWVYVVQDVNSVLDQHHTPAREKAELIQLLMNAQKAGN